MTVLTLVKEMTGDAALLNGKILVFKQNGNQEGEFFDLISHKTIHTTSKINSIINTSNNTIIISTMDDIYELTDVLNIIPTKEKPIIVTATAVVQKIDEVNKNLRTYKCEVINNTFDIYEEDIDDSEESEPLEEIKETIDYESINIDDIEAIDVQKSFKHINYSDGYDKTYFTFNRSISEEEFIAYLNAIKYQIKPFEVWYNNYSKIEGSGNTWIYTWVLVYTD